MDENKSRIINKSVTFALTMIILIALGVYLFSSGEKMTGLIIAGSPAVGLFIFFIFFIPKANKIQITRYGLQCSSYGNCRTYFWNEMKNVKLDEDESGNKKQLLLEIYQSGSNKTDTDRHVDVPLNAEAYGYTPESLYDLINKNLIQHSG